MKDSKASFDFVRVLRKLTKLVNDFMVKAVRTWVRFPPSPLIKEDIIMICKLVSLLILIVIVGYIYNKFISND